MNFVLVQLQVVPHYPHKHLLTVLGWNTRSLLKEVKGEGLFLEFAALMYSHSQLMLGTCRHYLVAMTTVLWGQYKSGQVAWQVQSFEVPHQVPEDNRVLVNNARGRDGLVALVHQQALQLLPQDQWAQVGHRHWRWGRDSCPALCFLRCRHFGCRTEQRWCVLLCNRITFLGRPEGRQGVHLINASMENILDS